MKIVVITGGIGSGKSTAAKHLRSRGAMALDLDEVAADVLSSGSPVLSAVAREFGAGILRADGTLDRAELARVAFASPEGAAALDAIVHPAVASETMRRLSELRASANPPLAVVVEVPLLAEAPWFADVADVVLAISAPDELRIRRAVARGDFAEDDVRRRLALQASDEARAALADAVIVNDGSRERFLGEVDLFWDEYVGAGEER